MNSPTAASSGWAPQSRAPFWVVLLSVATLAIGAAGAVMWMDLVGLTRSPLCGPRCFDPPIERALLAGPQSVFKAYRPARQAAMRQIQISPFDTAAWLRVVLLERKVAGGVLSPSAVDALEMSYKRAPVDASVVQWRLPIAFTHWATLTPALKRRVLDELRVLYRAPQNREAIKGLSRDIGSVEGLFAFNLSIQSMDEGFEVRSGRETPAPKPSVNAQSEAIAGD